MQYTQDNDYILSLTRGEEMIVYTPFWKTLERKNISTYFLINTYKVSSSTISRLRNNKPLNTTTLNDLCIILDCELHDIVKFEKEKKS